LLNIYVYGYLNRVQSGRRLARVLAANVAIAPKPAIEAAASQNPFPSWNAIINLTKKILAN